MLFRSSILWNPNKIDVSFGENSITQVEFHTEIFCKIFNQKMRYLKGAKRTYDSIHKEFKLLWEREQSTILHARELEGSLPLGFIRVRDCCDVIVEDPVLRAEVTRIREEFALKKKEAERCRSIPISITVYARLRQVKSCITTIRGSSTIVQGHLITEPEPLSAVADEGPVKELQVSGVSTSRKLSLGSYDDTRLWNLLETMLPYHYDSCTITISNHGLTKPSDPCLIDVG